MLQLRGAHCVVCCKASFKAGKAPFKAGKAQLRCCPCSNCFNPVTMLLAVVNKLHGTVKTSVSSHLNPGACVGLDPQRPRLTEGVGNGFEHKQALQSKLAVDTHPEIPSHSL